MPSRGRSHLTRPRLVRAFAAPAVTGSLAATLPPVAGSESGAVTSGAPTVLFQEGFESGTLTGGWFDDTVVPVATDNRPGSSGTKAMEWAWALGATQPTGVGSCRRDFTPTDRVYLSYWIKCSSNWVGSGVAFHPHMFHFLTTADDHYIGPSKTHLTTYDELLYTTGGMVYQMSLQDSLNIDTGNLLVDLTGVTENRAVCGYNGRPETGMVWDAYDNGGGDYRNYKTLVSPSLVLTDANKNQWHHFESYWQMNTISGGVGQPDGVMQLWVDGVQIHNRNDVYFRTNANPTMQFRTFVMAPYMQVGAPVAESMWIDDITVSTGRTEGTSAQHPNEPVGYTALFDDALNTTPTTGAVLYTDATAPTSPPTVTRVTLPAGYGGGYSPWVKERDIASRGASELYIHMAIRYSSNWQGHGTGVNKLGFAWIHDNPSVAIIPLGSGSNNLPLDISLQNVPDSRGRLPPNLGPNGYVTRGVWHNIEVQLIANTPGVANGIVRAWLDGVQTHYYTDVQFAGSGQATVWQYASLYPIWGGVGGTVTSDMTIDYDHWYASAP